MGLTGGLDFSGDWLALREPFDHVARAPAVTAATLAHLAGRTSPLVVDLGCGRGSSLRFLRPRLGPGVRWRLVDRDPALLEQAARALAPGDPVELVTADLRAGDLAELVAEADLVTAAALIDLVDEAWLATLVAAVEIAGAALVVTGSVDGRVQWEPVHPSDGDMASAYARHQGGEKGFGRALGPAAPARLAEHVAAAGRRVATARGDWSRVGDPPLQRAYLAGVVEALAEHGVGADVLEAWHAFRLEAIATAASRLTVGHVDLFAAPRER
ncbi:MAG: class I SAM-dependent methyltransferase [Alphaproteobacteria bacterium]